MDYFVPIVGGNALPYFKEVAKEFNYVIIPYYEVYLLPEEVKQIKEVNPQIKTILSSIMPDEYLEDPKTFDHFIEYAKEIDADYLLAWDIPTYLDDKKRIDNMLIALDKIDKLRGDFEVIPLVKGGYIDEIMLYCDELLERGFEVAGFHVSQYLSTDVSPYPELRGKYSNFYDFMIKIIQNILKYPFNEVLLVGGAGPRFYDKLLSIDSRIRLAGYTWYIDGMRYRVYTPSSKVVDVRDGFYICKCDVCRYYNPVILRRKENIVQHNIITNKYLIEKTVGRRMTLSEPFFTTYDLILDTYEDLIILNELMVGHRKSLWRLAIKALREMKPYYLILTGDLIHEYGAYEEYREFIYELRDIAKHTTIFYVSREEDYKRYWNMLKKLYLPEKDLLKNKLVETDREGVLETILKIFLTARYRNMKIKKITWDGDVDIRIKLFGSLDKPLNQILDELEKYLIETFTADVDWIITDLAPKPYIDKPNRIAIPGELHRYWGKYEKPEPGAVYINSKGEVEVFQLTY